MGLGNIVRRFWSRRIVGSIAASAAAVIATTTPAFAEEPPVEDANNPTEVIQTMDEPAPVVEAPVHSVVKKTKNENKQHITVTVDTDALENVAKACKGVDFQNTSVQDMINIAYYTGKNPSAAYHAPKKGIKGNKIVSADQKERYIGINLLDALITAAGRNFLLYNLDETDENIATLNLAALQDAVTYLQNDLTKRFGSKYSFNVKLTGSHVAVEQAKKDGVTQAAAFATNVLADLGVLGQSAAIQKQVERDYHKQQAQRDQLNKAESDEAYAQQHNNSGCSITSRDFGDSPNNPSSAPTGLGLLGLTVALSYLTLRRTNTVKATLDSTARQLTTQCATREDRTIKTKIQKNYRSGITTLTAIMQSEYARHVAALITNCNTPTAPNSGVYKTNLHCYDARVFAIANYVENNAKFMTIEDITEIEQVIVAASNSRYAQRTNDVQVLLASLVENITLLKQQKEDEATFLEEIRYAKLLETRVVEEATAKHELVQLNAIRGNTTLALQLMQEMNLTEIKQLEKTTDYTSMTPETKERVQSTFDAAARYARKRYGNDVVAGLIQSSYTTLYKLISQQKYDQAQQIVDKMNDQELLTARKAMQQAIHTATASTFTADENAFFEQQLYQRELAAKVDAGKASQAELIHLYVIQGNYALAATLLAEMSRDNIQATEATFEYHSVTAQTRQRVEEVFDRAAQAAMPLEVIAGEKVEKNTEKQKKPKRPETITYEIERAA